MKTVYIQSLLFFAAGSAMAAEPPKPAILPPVHVVHSGKSAVDCGAPPAPPAAPRPPAPPRPGELSVAPPAPPAPPLPGR